VVRTVLRLRTWRRALPDLAGDARGAAAVEFAMVLPLMVALFVGGVEFSQGFTIARKVTLTARTVSDLVARAEIVTNTEMSNILDAATAVAAPFSVSNLRVIVSQLKVDSSLNAKVTWSDARNASPRSKDQPMAIPAALKIGDTYVILGEVEYDYTPVIGHFITGTMTLRDQIYMRPRQGNCVTRDKGTSKGC
jgi:Flp pilus assembly protein TadG